MALSLHEGVQMADWVPVAAPAHGHGVQRSAVVHGSAHGLQLAAVSLLGERNMRLLAFRHL
eukprot:1162584-Pleurochrysis_carterae.AAC.5